MRVRITPAAGASRRVSPSAARPAAGRRQGGEACLGRGDVLLPRTFHDQRDLLLGSLEVGLYFDPGTGRVHFLHGDAVHGTQLPFARQLGGSVRRAGPGRGRGRPGPRHRVPAVLAQPGEHRSGPPPRRSAAAVRAGSGSGRARPPPPPATRAPSETTGRARMRPASSKASCTSRISTLPYRVSGAERLRCGGRPNRRRAQARPDQGRRGGAHRGKTHGQDSRGSGRKRPCLPWGRAVVFIADDLHQHPFLAPAVELAVEDLLPCAEMELAASHRHHHLAAHDQRLRWASALSS